MNSRIDYLDVSKGILITLVVAAHIFQQTLFWKFAYSFHMEAFFVISGLLICYTASYKKSWTLILRSKIRTLMIPFLFFELWGVLRDIVIHGVQQSWKGYLYNTISLNFNNGVLWFLFVLFFSELLFIFALKTIHSRWAIFTISVVFLSIAVLIPSGTNYLKYLRMILQTVFFLSVGFCWKNAILKWSLPGFLLSGLLLCALVLSFGCVEYSAVSLNNLPLFLLGAICGTYLIVQAGKNPWLHWMKVPGRETLIIFGTHSFYYVVFGKMIGIADFRSVPFSIGLAVLVMVAVAEIPTIYLLNRFLPLFAGKRKPSLK